jgi:cytochrome c553
MTLGPEANLCHLGPMKWAHLIIYIACAGFGLSGCQSPENKPPFTCNHLTPLQSDIPGSPGNLIMLKNRPSGSSELAALMHDMLGAMKERRGELLNKTPLGTFKDYEKIKCAWPTTMETRSAQFDELANLTLMAIDGFNQAPTQDAYNTIVASCVTCHQTSCPGPLAAIRPLAINPGEAFKALDEKDPGSCEVPPEQK